jgi:hypothetical protein
MARLFILCVFSVTRTEEKEPKLICSLSRTITIKNIKAAHEEDVLIKHSTLALYIV